MGLLTLSSARARKATVANANGEVQPGRLRQALDVLVIALFFALVTGLFESGRIIVLRAWLDWFTWLPADTVWMAPVAYVAYLIPPAALVALIVFFLPRPVPIWGTVYAFVATSVFSVMLVIAQHRVSEWALAVLALGAAFQLSKVIERHWPSFRRLAGRGALVMSLITLGLLGGTEYLRGAGREGAAAQARAGSLNVLFIILDTVRAASLSLYGYARPTTPQLEQWAQKGVVFDNAFAPAPWTLPSHASMFTGRWPHELSADWRQPLERNYPTLAETLQGAGYETAGFVANLKYTAEDSGLDRGFGEYRSYLRTWEQLLRSSMFGQWIRKNRNYPTPVRKRAEDINAEFLQWVSERSDPARPFFVFLNYYDAHLPYRTSATFRKKFASGDRRTGDYDASIGYLDAKVDQLLRGLEKRGALENTLVIITSDHGELLGEHGLTEHGNSLYLPVLHVPLVMWGPRGVPANLRVKEPVTLRDLPRTVLELTIGNTDLPGQSLANVWSGQPNTTPILGKVSQGIRTAPEWPVTRGGITSLLSDGWHYIRNDDGAEELYSTTADPGELKNLVKDPAVQAPLESLRTEAAQLLKNKPAGRLKTR